MQKTEKLTIRQKMCTSDERKVQALLDAVHLMAGA